jgi:hypothetical protein
VTGIENRPPAPTVMEVIESLDPFDPCRVICPVRGRGLTPGPPTAWSVPVRVPVGPGGPLGAEQPVRVIPVATAMPSSAAAHETFRFMRTPSLSSPVLRERDLARVQAVLAASATLLTERILLEYSLGK